MDDNPDRIEALDRAALVRDILHRIDDELIRLECIPHLTAEDVNVLSMAKGFAHRARVALEKLGVEDRESKS